MGNSYQCKIAFLDCQRLEKHRRALPVARRFEPIFTVRAMSATTSVGKISQPSSGVGAIDEHRVNLRKKRKAVRLDGFRPAVGLCIVNNDGLVFAARCFPHFQENSCSISSYVGVVMVSLIMFT